MQLLEHGLSYEVPRAAAAVSEWAAPPLRQWLPVLPGGGGHAGMSMSAGGDYDAMARMLHAVVASAFEDGASAIHIESNTGKAATRVRFRMPVATRGNIMHDHAEVPPQFRGALVSRIKLLCGLDPADWRMPQQGSLAFPGGDGMLPAPTPILTLTLGVTTLPIHPGIEDVVIRLPRRAA
jgi:type II secretory ATPase GspE/PulE/Tfp pilus assembly ATPase PilB-like protein